MVEHVWRDLPRDTGAVPWLVEGQVCAVLAGRVIAVAWGTQYAIRLSAGALAEADAAGHLATQRWAGGSVTDLEAALGPGWRFGRWDRREPAWLAGLRSEG